MDKNFINVINDHLSISLKKVNIIDVKKSFTIDNYYDIDNTIIYQYQESLGLEKYKKLLSNDSALFIPAHNTVPFLLDLREQEHWHMKILLIRRENIYVKIEIQLLNQISI